MKTLLTLCLTVAGYAVFVTPSVQAEEEKTTTMHHHHHHHHHMHHHMHHSEEAQKPAAERAPGQ